MAGADTVRADGRESRVVTDAGVLPLLLMSRVRLALALVLVLVLVLRRFLPVSLPLLPL
ncbi:hypothetical protein [Streptomyces sp. NBC_01408]|uniref:hypothetical protein n=1 Tax=Streptomyces sp. NBC_01408 TaxID=2903855 RepID=UPI00225919C1|nr:hypothetical protein [Streptomyces sp. NBC_01408]MCX4692748.1 hypothetical protein [Streptomyces sp. NBC_01408]